MHRYSAKIRLGGSLHNEVYKENMSAAEVMLLRALHGFDAVVDIQEGRNDASSHAQERERLLQLYCKVSEDGLGVESRSKLDFNRMFGPEHVDLPGRLPDFVKRDELEKNPPKTTGRTRIVAPVDVKPGSISSVDLAG